MLQNVKTFFETFYRTLNKRDLIFENDVNRKNFIFKSIIKKSYVLFSVNLQTSAQF